MLKSLNIIFLGVEYRNECFCGNHDELDSLDVTLDTSLCKQFTCPADNNSFCGGFNAIAIYNTGFGSKLIYLYSSF